MWIRSTKCNTMNCRKQKLLSFVKQCESSAEKKCKEWKFLTVLDRYQWIISIYLIINWLSGILLSLFYYTWTDSLWVEKGLSGVNLPSIKSSRYSPTFFLIKRVENGFFGGFVVRKFVLDSRENKDHWHVLRQIVLGRALWSFVCWFLWFYLNVNVYSFVIQESFIWSDLWIGMDWFPHYLFLLVF